MVHPYINQMLETSSNHAPMTYSACNNIFIQIKHQVHLFWSLKHYYKQQMIATLLLKPSEHQPL